MAGQPVRLGPFVGGMNTYSGPASIADNEAVDILNMDVDLDGALMSRPGVEVLAAPAGLSDYRAHIIGTYRTTTGVVYMIFNYAGSLQAFNTSSGVWTVISAITATACVQYNDKLYIVIKPSGVTQGGGKWDPVGGYVAVAAMPRGYSTVVYKERMFISASRNGDETSINRVKFSNAGNPDAWTSTDTFDVAGGDGEDITAIVIYQASIVVFKSDSTYLFAYESSPTKGQVQKISNSIGANNQNSVVEYENNLFVMHENKVFRISNWNWEHANIKVPFKYSNAATSTDAFGTSVSILNNRLICRYFDNTYVLGLKTGAWVRWQYRTRKNWLPNPSFEVDTSGWLRSNATFVTLTRVTTSAVSGVASADVAFTAAGYVTTAGNVVGVNPGESWNASIYIKGAGSGEISIFFTDAANVTVGTLTYSGEMPLTAGAQRFSVTAVAPAGAAFVRMRVYQRSLGLETINIDAALVEQSNMVLPYIEGTKDYFPSEFVVNPNLSATTGANAYYAGNFVTGSSRIYRFVDVVDSVVEMLDIKLITKSYDFGPSYGFKRLFWWGVDILSRTPTTYKVSPLVYNSPVTWGQIKTVPVSQLQTWGRPLDVSLDVTDSANTSNPSAYRTFIKLLKSLRFRQAFFTIESTVDGTTATGPYRIFSLTAFVDSKQLVSKQVS